MPCHNLLYFMVALTVGVYGSAISSLVEKAATPAVTATVTGSYISSLGLYEVNVTLGGKTYLANFDTGSFAPWVNNFTTSTAYSDKGEMLNLQYDSGAAVSGEVYQGDFKLGTLEVTNQAFGAMSVGPPHNGVLGMGPLSTYTVSKGGSNNYKENSFWTNIRSQLAKPIFGVDLQGWAKGTATYYFGYTPTSWNMLSNTAVNMTQFSAKGGAQGWPIQISSMSVSSGPQNVVLSECSYWHPDTGTHNLYVDNTTANTYWKAVPSHVYSETTQTWSYDCSATLPDLSFKTYDGASITITGGAISAAWLSKSSKNVCMSSMKVATSQFCILGQPLFHSSYVVFDSTDGSKPRVGFSTKK